MVRGRILLCGLLAWLTSPAIGAPAPGQLPDIRVEALTPAARDDRQRLEVRAEPVAAEAWFNQPLRVVLWIASDSPYASLDTGTAPTPGVEVIELPPERRLRAPPEAAPRTEYRVGGGLYPRGTGPVELALPVVRFRRDGLDTHRIEATGARVQVHPLPRFVPPTLPIGPLQLDVEGPSQRLLTRGALEVLRRRITGPAPPGYALSGLLRQLRGDTDLDVYPPRDLTDTEGGWRDHGYVTVYERPFVPRAMGRVQLPALRLQYFDPASGKLVTRHHASGRYLSLPRGLVWVAVALLAVGVLWTLRALFRFLARRLRIRRGYRRALRTLQRAGTPAELKAALLEIAVAEAWPPNLTLDAWRRRWVARYPRLDWIDGDIQRLQAWHYGRRDAALEEVRGALVALCRRRMSLLR